MFDKIRIQNVADTWKGQLQRFPKVSRQEAENAILRFEGAAWYPMVLEETLTSLEVDYDLNDRGMPLIHAGENLPAVIVQIVNTYLTLTQQGNGENEHIVFD